MVFCLFFEERKKGRRKEREREADIGVMAAGVSLRVGYSGCSPPPGNPSLPSNGVRLVHLSSKILSHVNYLRVGVLQHPQ